MGAAVIQASWGWDESERICVEDEKGSAVVDVRYEEKEKEKVWLARLEGLRPAQGD